MSRLSAVDCAAGQYWGEMLKRERPPRYRWWDDEITRRHINEITCGEPLDGLHAGFHKRLAAFAGEPLARGISVGCGMGIKEFWLLQDGVVEHFDLYEISKENVELGVKTAAEMGLSERVHFRLADVFAENIQQGQYDLVYWNNALHHMPDALAAVQWSKQMLRRNGIFAMDDFIGPSRFQWTDENLRWANLVRSTLTDRFRRNPWAEGTLVQAVLRDPPEAIIAVDPSEAADSGRIEDSIRAVFPDAEVVPTGGALYHLALNDIFCNFESEDDLVLLRHILLLDQHLAESGTTQYAVALARNAPVQAPDNPGLPSVDVSALELETRVAELELALKSRGLRTVLRERVRQMFGI